MSTPASSISPSAEERALMTKGASVAAVYRLVEQVVRQLGPRFEAVADVGCGAGALGGILSGLAGRYVGLDVVRYGEFPASAGFVQVDLDASRWPVESDLFSLVLCVETIEHLENPRAVFRELSRITRQGGWIVVTTPNQLSLLSKMTLLLKNQFTYFQERPGLYPAHRTALLEIDLMRIAQECGLVAIRSYFTDCGRVPFVPLKWPVWLGFRGRAFSDNILVCARKP